MPREFGINDRLAGFYYVHVLLNSEPVIYVEIEIGIIRIFNDSKMADFIINLDTFAKFDTFVKVRNNKLKIIEMEKSQSLYCRLYNFQGFRIQYPLIIGSLLPLF